MVSALLFSALALAGQVDLDVDFFGARVISTVDIAENTPETRDVFLECAYFSPLAIAGKARSYGMHTDASHRYERGVDHGLQHLAMERATQLLLDIVGGEAGPVTESCGNLPEEREVKLRFESVERQLGVQIDNPDD